MLKASKLLILLLFSCSFLLTSCNKEELPDESVFTMEDEIALGEKLHSIIQSSNQFDLISLDDHPMAKTFLAAVKNTLTTNSELTQKDKFNWEINIIDGPAHNSFALPGGFIYIYSGLLIDQIQNGAACYGVLGHEIALIDGGHTTSKLKEKYSLSLLLDVALGNNEDAAIDLINYIITEPYTETQSREADELAVALLCPIEIKISQYAGFINGLDATTSWLITHPSYGNRNSLILDRTAALSCVDSLEFTASYKEFVSRL